MRLTVPALAPEASTLDAALAYARSGWYVLPVRRGLKDPGSVVGKGWQHQSSREAQQLVGWYAGTDHGLALHVGRSGAVVFDVDNPEACPDVLKRALAVPGVPFQSTRTAEIRRGHYLYTAPEGRLIGNATGQLAGGWGDVRGRNGVIIAAPSLHEKNATGGRYLWEQTGDVPTLPDSLAELLPDGQVSVDAVTDAEVIAFLSEHVEQTHPALLAARLRLWTARLDAGESRHASACGYLVGALDEARCGYYLAADAVEQMKALFIERATTSKPGDPLATRRTAPQAAAEFDGILAWSVGQSLNNDLSRIRERLETPPAEAAPVDPLAITATAAAGDTDVPADGEPTFTELIAAKYPVLDWHELWNTTTADPVWLCEPLLGAGKVVALYSPAKTGKSLLCLEIAAALASGRPVLGNPAQPPMQVLYVDLENSPEDLRERLEDLGYGPADLDRLRYLSFPSLPALDSRQGGLELLAVAQQHDAVLIVLDTVSRIISGEEDKSDTFRALYRHALMPLKAEGRAVLRLDHSGKDLSRGQRGSTGKVDDVDAVWSLVKRTPTVFDLRRTHSRSRHGAEHLALTRLAGPLRHEVPSMGAPTEVDELINHLDALGVALDAGRPTCRDALAGAGVTAKTAVLAEAVRQRRGGHQDCPQKAGTAGREGGVDGSDMPVPSTVPQRSNTGRGQSGDSGDSTSTGPNAALSPCPSLQGRDRDRAGPRETNDEQPRPVARVAS